MAKARPIDRLSYDIFDNFIGRKGALMLGVVTDTDSKGLPVYPMPQGIEHMDYVPTLVGTDRTGLLEIPSLAERFIPSIIEFEMSEDERDYLVKGLITGVSGIEIGLRVRHDKGAIELAHQRVLNIIDAGDFQKSPNFEAKVVLKYAKKA